MFTPSRLQLARTRRGYTKKRLAERVGVTSRSITGFESGEYAPDDETIELIAATLRFPVAFFEGDDLEEAVADAVSFRSMSRMTAAQRHAAIGAGTLAYAFHDWIRARFRLPEPNVPKLGPGVDAETAAEIVRTEWGLGSGPISNVVHLLEAHGVRVFSLAEDSRDVDAFSVWRGGVPFVFLNTKKSAEHSRLDAAHELGHLVMHTQHGGPQGKEAEQEAQRFGAALLMPATRLRATMSPWPSVSDLIEQKGPWKVSVAALNYRLHELGVISDWHYRTLCIDIAKRGYRANEPRPIPRETSQVLSKVFTALRKEGIGKAEIATELDLYPEELDNFVFHLALLPVTRAPAAGTGSGPRGRPRLDVIRGGRSDR